MTFDLFNPLMVWPPFDTEAESIGDAQVVRVLAISDRVVSVLAVCGAEVSE